MTYRACSAWAALRATTRRYEKRDIAVTISSVSPSASPASTSSEPVTRKGRTLIQKPSFGCSAAGAGLGAS